MTEHPKHALPIGFAIGGYEIVRMIGQGGFGIVYEARNPDTGERVAIKEFYPSAIATRHGNTIVVNSDRETGTFANVLERFRSTAVLQYSFDHPNILNVHNYIRAENTGYMITDYVDGQSLREVLQPHGGHMPSEQMLADVFRPIAGAIRYIHAKGHLHRDISPDNIMVDRFGKPVLIDFGALKRDLRASGKFSSVMFVREDYSPPEQQGRDLEQPEGFYTDIFALAGTMHYALAGEPPPRVTARALHSKGDPYVPIAEVAKIACPRHVYETIDRSLRLPCHERPQSMAELQTMLGWDDGKTAVVSPPPPRAEPIPPPPRTEPIPPPPPPPALPRPPSRSWLGYAAVGAVALIVGGVFALQREKRTDEQESGPKPVAFCEQADAYETARGASGPDALRTYIQRCGSGGSFLLQARSEFESRMYAAASSCIRTSAGCSFDGCVQVYTGEIPDGSRAGALRQAAADAAARCRQPAPSYCEQAEAFNTARAGADTLRAYVQRCGGGGRYLEQARSELEDRLFSSASSCIRAASSCNFDGCLQIYAGELPAGARAGALRQAAADAAAAPRCRPADNQDSLVPRGSEQPSFDCAKAGEPIEHLICADAELAQWDARLGRAYGRKRGALAAAKQKELRQEQIDWLKRRNARCNIPRTGNLTVAELAPHKSCVAEMTRDRVLELERN